MQRIRECEERTGFYEALGWCLIGFGASALLSGLTNFGSMTFFDADAVTGKVISVHIWAVTCETFCLVAGALAVAFGIVSLRFAGQHHSDRTKLRLMIAQDMEDYENNFHKPAPTQVA